jgi:hypothetical protein
MENKEFKYYAIDYRYKGRSENDFSRPTTKREFMSCVNEEDVLPFAEKLAKSEGNLKLEQIWEIDPTTPIMEYKRLVYSKDK